MSEVSNPHEKCGIRGGKAKTNVNTTRFKILGLRVTHKQKETEK